MSTIETQDLPEGDFPDGPDPELEEVLETPPAKRGPGRPPTRKEPVELPAPRRYPLKTEEFFRYWKDMEKIDPNRLIVYVWRTHPVINKRWLNPKAYTNIGKMEKAPDPDYWRQEMLHRWGSGNYKLILKDEGLRKPKGIAQTFVIDLEDPDYPAWIENLDELVMDHPSNQSFINGLRQKGALPGERSEEDMATQETMATMAGTIERLANKAATPPPTPPLQPQSATDAARATVEMAGEVFKQGIELGKTSVTAQADAKVKAAEALASASDPMASFGTLSKLINLVKEMQPPPTPPTTVGNSNAELVSMVNSFMGREATLQGKIMEILQAQIAAAEARQTAAAANPQPSTSAPKDDLITSLEKLANMKEKLQTLFGGGGEEEREDKVPIWMQLAQTALVGLPTLATAIVAMSFNLAVAKTGQGTPIPPGPMPNPTDANAALPAGDQPNPNLSPGGDMKASALVYATVLKQIERPLINHLNDPTKTGADFAAALMDFHGKLAYDSIRELGKDTILALLQSYPPIAQVITPIPERISQFLDEFLDAERILAEEEEGDEDEGAGAGQIIDIKPVTDKGEKGKRGAKAATT